MVCPIEINASGMSGRVEKVGEMVLGEYEEAFGGTYAN